jgi:hypothetical protein
MEESMAQFVLDETSKHAVEECGPAIAHALSDKKVSELFKRHVKAYVDAHSHVLMAANPGRRLFFKGPDLDNVHKLVGVSEEQMQTTIKKHGLVDPGWKTGNKALPWVLALVMRQYALNKDEDGAEHALIFMAISFYTSIQYKYWRFEPTGTNEAIMMHVINSLSNKFKLKQHGTILGMLTEISATAWKTYRADVEAGTDRRLLYFIAQVRSRIDDAMHNIASKFYEALDSGKAGKMYVDREDAIGPDGEDLGPKPLDNTSAAITRLTEATMNRALQVGVDRRASAVAARICGVSQSATEQALEKIIKEHPEKARELISLILEMYFAGGKYPVESIGTKTFVFVAMQNYTKSNTNDQAVLRSRELLEELLGATSQKYTQSERAATKGNFRKAIYVYHVLLVQQSYLGN